MQYHFDVMNVRHISGKEDKTKKYTAFSGVITLADGKRDFVEFFENGQSNILLGPSVIDLDIDINFEHKPVVKVKSISPARAKQAA